MKQFLLYVLAGFTTIFLLVLISFGIIALLIPSDEVKIKSQSVLHLKLKKAIIERADEDPFENVLDEIFDGGDNGSMGLVELKKTIKKAKTDKNIEGIYLELGMLPVGFAILEEVRNTLIDFKTSKKFIFAHGEYFDEKAYYIASIADKIFLNPTGAMEFNGLSSERTFFKGSLEKLEIKPEIFRVGDFKSAVEPFFLDKMSDANRKQTAEYLNSIYDHYLTKVSESRKIDLAELTNISDSMLIRDAKSALKYNLVTDLAYYDQVEDEIKKQLKLKTEDKIKFVSYGKYQKVEDTQKSNSSENRIAIIIAQGEIAGGEGNETRIGSDRIAGAIRQARLDKKVKAIVLRVNSPGGSALASDVIWREVVLAKKEKPVIASMSDLAASGGYYISMAANTIVAEPTTITGSIGVFGVLFNTENMLRDKLGITTDRVNTGDFSDLGNPNRKMTDTERRYIQQSVDQIYEEFTTRAAEGRNMKVEDIKAIAGGRVWSGTAAKANGLVDELGSLEDAVRIAAKQAKLKEDDYKVKYLPATKNFFDKISSGFKTSYNAESYLKQELGDLYVYFKLLKDLKSVDPIQTRLPFDLEIR